MKNDVIVGLGSNIDPMTYIEKALTQIKTRFLSVNVSEFIFTEPIGFKHQAPFCNGAVRFTTDLSAEALKSWLLALEDALGRIRTENKNGPRTIDLDILVWNGKIVDPDVGERDFLQSALKALQPTLF
ncbi:MAG: 2-amino-4-hydroxy-6-hydroxymethyldihydropteridine diphosphokinase [Nitrospirae bacterium]|nr:2-amino-4-hydroxy-6-hydroxymethyldihydropteridine diphosphokinase [Candidatus Manganitrophaceae bacterium]